MSHERWPIWTHSRHSIHSGCVYPNGSPDLHMWECILRIRILILFIECILLTYEAGVFHPYVICEAFYSYSMDECLTCHRMSHELTMDEILRTYEAGMNSSICEALLQHTATHCNTLQHNAENEKYGDLEIWRMLHSMKKEWIECSIECILFYSFLLHGMKHFHRMHSIHSECRFFPFISFLLHGMKHFHRMHSSWNEAFP